jgi:hypothetical protein
MKPSLTMFCLLWHGPNGRMVSWLSINGFLSVQSIDLMVIMSPTAILLCHGEVPCVIVLISRQSSNFANFSSARFPLEPSATC